MLCLEIKWIQVFSFVTYKDNYKQIKCIYSVIINISMNSNANKIKE